MAARIPGLVRFAIVGVISALVIASCDGGSHAPHASSAHSSLRSSTAAASAAGSQGGSTAAASSTPTANVTRAAHVATLPVDLVGRYGRFKWVWIPSTTGFRPRRALIFVPRDLRPHAGRPVPVLELLHGTPGQPSDWLTRGGLLRTLDAFAATHGGRAPIVVLPDINGSQHADSECIRTAGGANVEGYLTRDVVRYVRTTYRQAVGSGRWWIAGLSEGGICAAVLALRYPATYSGFGDFSGLARPTVEHVTATASDAQLYGGSTVARLQHDPVWLLQHRRYPHMAGWFVCGLADTKVRAAQAQVAAAARAAGLPVVAGLRPGKHVWTIWGPAVQQLLPWLMRHAAA